MALTGGSGLILVFIFVGLLLGVVFLFSKRKGKGILANKLFLGAATALLIVFALLVKGPLVDFYNTVFKTPPYDISEFKSIVFEYGDGDSLINKYNSATGDYQFVDRRDSLVKTHLYLNKDELLYLHMKAAEDGFWDFPADETHTDTTNNTGVKSPTYLIEFNYANKSKKVLFNINYDGPHDLVQRNRKFIEDIQSVMKEAEARR